MAETAVILSGARRQFAHWQLAIERLERLNDIAAPRAWSELEQYVGVALRDALTASVERLRQEGAAATRRIQGDDPWVADEALQRLRRSYLRTETTIDFFADAINTRTNRHMASLLGGVDWLAAQSMTAILQPLGHATPPVLTYVDKGLGASILKAGLRLWDRATENPVAAIKIVRHNLLRPTAVIHEAGHQVAHILGWNDELAGVFETLLPGELGETWASWSSEIAADALAFVHAGYASVAALHDVVDGGPARVFLMRPGDPHPVSFLRVLLGVQMCRRYYGDGPWDDLAQAWVARYPPNSAPDELAPLLRASLPVLDKITEITLEQPLVAFGNRSLTDVIDPRRVAPQALRDLERSGGDALFRSPFWLRQEGLRLLALTGLRFAVDPASASMRQQMGWIQELGDLRVAA